MNASGFKIKNNKINALSRVTLFMNLSKKKMLMNSFLSRNSVIVHWCGCVIVAP